jgi:hypothetical protein
MASQLNGIQDLESGVEIPLYWPDNGPIIVLTQAVQLSNYLGTVALMHKPNRDAIAQRGTPIPTQCFALQTQWFCYGNTVILLRKHTTFPPLVLLALPMHIQAYHDPINDPHYQPSPCPQPRRCCLCCRL